MYNFRAWTVFLSIKPQDYFKAVHVDWQLVKFHLNGLRIGKLRQETVADSDAKVSFSTNFSERSAFIYRSTTIKYMEAYKACKSYKEQIFKRKLIGG